MRRLFVLWAALILFQPLPAHEQARFHVLVDTDGDAGDLRALCMMLADPEFEVIAISAVAGEQAPEVTLGRVRSLLQQFGHEGIPLAGEYVNEAVELILHETDLEPMPVDIVAMGPLTNIAAAVSRMTSIAGEINTLFWTGPEISLESITENTREIEKVRESGIPIEAISTGQAAISDPALFLDQLRNSTSPYSKAVLELSLQGVKPEGETSGMIRIGGESIPLYMVRPGCFTRRHLDGLDCEAVLSPGVPAGAAILEMLNGEKEDKSIIFTRFPSDPSLLEPDVAAIAPEVVQKYGPKEWRIVALTNEFHEHLGIYSILGAKMGLRAREYFHVGLDELTILSFAGLTPPLSCLNDGLQVSTGATLGHGTIQVDRENTFPGAKFSFKDRPIMITVREEIRNKIRDEVQYGVRTYGPETKEYWDYIRSLALKYWFEYNRYDLFLIE
jgi:pyrimidine-specific ribonucleoside hydrolase